MKSDYARANENPDTGGRGKGESQRGSVVPIREKEQRGQEGEGGKHERLKPADAE